jgi:hypothetical protein
MGLEHEKYAAFPLIKSLVSVSVPPFPMPPPPLLETFPLIKLSLSVSVPEFVMPTQHIVFAAGRPLRNVIPDRVTFWEIEGIETTGPTPPPSTIVVLAPTPVIVKFLRMRRFSL